ncbi:hypothetical protein [Bacillus xiapuensis]|uniref:hypothetical protein n=1 Tax=Bacillus xiapuensis TaxID=2014075 RepID=UPI0012FE3CC6|nr:hypothetical protein [Bacillus xiapuensis]
MLRLICNKKYPLRRGELIMLYKINHPEVSRKWLQVDVAYFDSLLEKFELQERMVRDSIELLKFNDVEKILNLGGFSIQLERTDDVIPIIKSLENALGNYTIKN